MRARRLPGFACLLLLLPTVSVGQGGGDQDAAETQAAIKMLQKQRRDILVKVAEVLKGGYLLGTVDFGKVAEAE